VGGEREGAWGEGKGGRNDPNIVCTYEFKKKKKKKSSLSLWEPLWRRHILPGSCTVSFRPVTGRWLPSSLDLLSVF
jgi:hypothetical protein